MNKKKYTKVGTDIEEVQKLNVESGLSYNDVKAFLAEIAEVDTVDEIPLEPLKENLEVDSNAYKLNRIPGSIQLDRNAHR